MSLCTQSSYCIVTTHSHLYHHHHVRLHKHILLSSLAPSILSASDRVDNVVSKQFLGNTVSSTAGTEVEDKVFAVLDATRLLDAVGVAHLAAARDPCSGVMSAPASLVVYLL